jgi:uncharacterized damage-inducible protein DinB
MTDDEMVLHLFRHMHWADARVWQTVLAEPRVSSDDVIRDRLFHMHLVQRAFLALWRNPRATFGKPPAFSTAVQLASWGRDCHREVGEYLRSLDRASLDRELRVPWSDHVGARFGRPADSTTLAETMLQVTSHSSHHRGQVNTRIRELGSEPPLVDFIVWVWLGRPEAEWPALDGAHA